MFLLAFVSLVLAVGPFNVCGITVDTKYGPVEGLTLPLHTGRSVNSFLAIPYAKPPLGALRWRPPEEPEPWEETLEAFELGAACTQIRPNLFLVSHPFWSDYDEDCLHLNIYTPEAMSGGEYPVMVFLHGGGHIMGANIQYPGHFLADKDVVVVVPNYRLNIFGFGSTSDDTALGNYGLLDQVLALRFVQENIAAFGGDPDRVTIFGESAGGETTGLMLMSPLAEGLFHAAILQSGTEMYRSTEINMEDDQNYMKQVAEQNDCPVDDGEEMMDCLRDVRALRILLSNLTCTPGYSCLWGPRVDGYFLPDAPRLLRESGRYHHVPEIIGLNTEDGVLLQPIRTWLGANRTMFEDVFRRHAARVAPRLPDPEREEDLVQAALFMYTPWPELHDPKINRDALGRYSTDVNFGYHTDYQAKQHSADGNDVYYYVYNHISQNTPVPDWMGCVHATELAYLFGYALLDIEGNGAVKNSTEIVTLVKYDDTDRAYADFMITLWTNFAKTGNPTPSPVSPPVGENDPVTWPTFSAGDLTYLWLGADVVESRSKYRQDYYAFLQYYIPYLELGKPVPFFDDMATTDDDDEDEMDILDVIQEYFPAVLAIMEAETWETWRDEEL